MRSAITISPTLQIPPGDWTWRAVRSGGPGGQNVNKVASKVELRLDVAGTRVLSDETKMRLRTLAGTRMTAEDSLLITSQLTRNQEDNLRDASEKVAELVRRALIRPKKRTATRPTRGSRERRLGSKARRGATKRMRQGGGED